MDFGYEAVITVMQVRTVIQAARRPANKSTLATPRMLLCTALVCLVAVLSGCRTAAFYGQAARGQWRILSGREPLQRLLDSPETTPQLKKKFELVLRLREFAGRELKLPVDGHYLSYVALPGEHVIWNVQVAPEFSLELNSWWYPLVGRLTYQGYFDANNARRFATNYARRGYDVQVGGVDAYSTLGWFKDPLLSSFIGYAEPDLAAVLFHELAHQKLFIGSDTDFDEAFATVVEEEGVRCWLKATHQEPVLEQYEQSLQRETQCRQLLHQTREELKGLYAQDAPLRAVKGQATPDELVSLRQRKAEILGHIRERYQVLRAQSEALRPFDRWMNSPFNNAKLANDDTYHRLVPGLRRVFRQQRGDFAAFYEAARQLGRQAKEKRHALLMAADPVGGS
ncbi:MAG: aminopeptidase [Verrucomicrobiota bacterium]